MVVSRRVTFLFSKEQFNNLKKLYWKLIVFLFGIGIFFILTCLLFTDFAQEYLKSQNSEPIWIFYGMLALTMLLVVNNAFFQGLQNFYWLALTGLIGLAMKIFLSCGFVGLGYGVSGALAGILCTSIITILFGIFLIQRNLSRHIGPAAQLQSNSSLPKLNVFPVLIANLGFVAMTQLDMVLVNWYFPVTEAGAYAAASVFGKAILYLPGGIVLALFPMVAKNQSDNISSAHLIRNAVLTTLLMCGTVAIIYWAMGDWLMNLFYGNRYIGSGQLLRWYGLAILPMALVMVAEHFLIAQGRTLFCWLFLSILPFQFAAIWLWHEELWMVLVNIGVSGATLAFLGYFMLFQEWFKAHRKSRSNAINGA
jgi:O-antigen/teichoic acid export membrane protein